MTMGLIDTLLRLHLERIVEDDSERAFSSFYDRYLEGYFNDYQMPEDPSPAVQLWYKLYINMEQGYIEIQNYE